MKGMSRGETYINTGDAVDVIVEMLAAEVTTLVGAVLMTVEVDVFGVTRQEHNELTIDDANTFSGAGQDGTGDDARFSAGAGRILPNTLTVTSFWRLCLAGGSTGQTVSTTVTVDVGVIVTMLVKSVLLKKCQLPRRLSLRNSRKSKTYVVIVVPSTVSMIVVGVVVTVVKGVNVVVVIGVVVIEILVDFERNTLQ